MELPPRLAQILHLASQGRTDKEIAVELGISPQTVETHWKRLRDRFGHRSRTQIIATAFGDLLAKVESERVELARLLDLERGARQALETRLAQLVNSPTRAVVSAEEEVGIPEDAT